MDSHNVYNSLELNKFIAALKELAKEDFSVSDDTILDKLYVHIENSKSLIGNLHLSEIGDWLDNVLSKCNSSEIFHGVFIFALRLAGLVGSSTKGFDMLKNKEIPERLSKLVANPDIQRDSCLMVPLIHVLGKITGHEEGWKWVTETMIWYDAIKILKEERSIYVKRAGITFISLLLTKSVKYDRDVGFNILLKFCEPLIKNNFIIIQRLVEDSLFEVNGDPKSVSSVRTLKDLPEFLRVAKNLTDVLEDILIHGETLPARLSLEGQSSNSMMAGTILTDLLQNCSSSENHQNLALLLIMIHVSNALGKLCDVNIPDTCSLQLFHSDVYGIIESMTSQGHFNALINVCVSCLSWKLKLNQERREYKHTCDSCNCFERTIVQCLIAFLHSRKHCIEVTDVSPYKEMFLRDIITNETSIHAKNLHQKLSSEFLLEKEKTKKIFSQYVQLGVFGISRSLGYITCPKNKLDIYTEVLNTIEYFYHMIKFLTDGKEFVIPTLLNLLTLASKVVEDHQIPLWRTNNTSSENIFLTIINTMSCEIDDVRVITTALQLLNKTIRFNIVPDLLQKIDNTPGMEVRVQQCNLALLTYKLSSPSWEVRDTTLEVLQTMIEMAGLLPWLFIDIFQADTLNRIMDLAQYDESAYVRASALNFFTKSVRGDFFEASVKKVTLLDIALNILREDNMPGPRRAACELISILYIKCDAPIKENDNEIYEAMFATTVNDLDWEVRKAALNFWHCTIDKLLNARMIPLQLDICSFLKYSNTSKKGVRTQILSVFNTLGDIGCLKAIWLGLNDECDLKVSQEAQIIIDHLEKLDHQWEFIDEILNCPEIEESLKNESAVLHKLRAKDFFLLLQKQAWRESLISRQNWIENKSDDLVSLLDHILNINSNIGDWDHNAVDCY